jgi:hypothetical protein
MSDTHGPCTIWPPVTEWRIVGIPDWAGRLDITLAVDTTAPMVLRAIELAAANHGVHLQRIRVESADEHTEREWNDLQTGRG